jgi:carboxymethylenebutenolidase
MLVCGTQTHGGLNHSLDALRDAFAKAKLPAEIEMCAGTKLGWSPTDSHVYDHDQVEKARPRMLALFDRALAV